MTPITRRRKETREREALAVKNAAAFEQYTAAKEVEYDQVEAQRKLSERNGTGTLHAYRRTKAVLDRMAGLTDAERDGLEAFDADRFEIRDGEVTTHALLDPLTGRDLGVKLQRDLAAAYGHEAQRVDRGAVEPAAEGGLHAAASGGLRIGPPA